MNHQWDWQVFMQDTGGGQTYLDWLLSAWGWTLAVSCGAWMVAVLFGFAVGTLRTVPVRWIARCASAWIELFRNIPLLVQIFIWYHVIPAMLPPLKSVPSLVLVILALGFFTSARIAEQVRAGIQSLPRGQGYAALALGFTLPQAYRYVLLPTALRIIIPPLTSEAMSIVKNSAVAFAVSISELTMFAMQAQEETSRGIEIYLAVTGLYVITALAVNGIMALIDKTLRIPGRDGQR